MEIVYQDQRVLVVIKPAGVLCAPGGIVRLLREQLEDAQACVLPVHRLDQAAGGLLLLARSHKAAALLGAQVQAHETEKDYLILVRGQPDAPCGSFADQLFYDSVQRKSFVVSPDFPGAKNALLHYRVLAQAEGLSLLHIRLYTGRTHQIRVQFSSRHLPLLGDRKYGTGEENQPLALWSCRLAFRHPQSGARMVFSHLPPNAPPWTHFSEYFNNNKEVIL